jgi:spermidine synthase
MILELVAGRMIAPHVGVSLYTWTSVIGVILAGISLGNFVGGKLADRFASLQLLGTLYILAAASSLAVLWTDHIYRITPNDWPVVVEIIAITSALFFVPSTILGMISPLVAKLAVSDLAKTGSTVGNIYAAGALGSIVGTFATGFVLIAWFGTYTIVWGVGLLLGAMGLVFFFGGRWQAIALVAIIAAGSSVYAVNQQWLKSSCLLETNYYCIKINEEQQAGQDVRLLVLDHLVHSYVNLNDPTQLVYGYEKMYAELAQYQAARKTPLRVLGIGGGGYTFPRYVEAIYPNSVVGVVEIDPGVTEIAYSQLGLPRTSKIVSYNEDARLFFARPPTMKYDLILGDAFNHYSVPYHLTTKEFDDRVHEWLASDGLYIINIIDGPQGDLMRAYVNTLRQSFKHVYLAPGMDSWRTQTRMTHVIVASDTALDTDALRFFDGGDDSVYFANALLSPDALQELLDEAPKTILTDQFAPVDNMLASVFREEVPK